MKKWSKTMSLRVKRLLPTRIESRSLKILLENLRRRVIASIVRLSKIRPSQNKSWNSLNFSLNRNRNRNRNRKRTMNAS